MTNESGQCHVEIGFCLLPSEKGNDRYDHERTKEIKEK